MLGGELTVIVLAFLLLLVVKGVKIVPQQQAFVVERLGKFDRVLEPGLAFLVPGIERVSYRHSLKEVATGVPEQTVITKDNVPLVIDGILYTRILDPRAASYGVANVNFAITQLAQTTMRAEIGKITLDKTFEERDAINANIVTAINEATSIWGIQCMRYEIRDIKPPQDVLDAMQLQMTAERQKRARVLESEGQRQSEINRAEGEKRAVVLASEAIMTEQINKAKGEAEAILTVANATAEGLKVVAKAIGEQGGVDAVSMRVAEQYVDAFRQLAQTNNTVLLPADMTNPGGMVAQALTIFQSLKTAADK